MTHDYRYSEEKVFKSALVSISAHALRMHIVFKFELNEISKNWFIESEMYVIESR